MDITNFDQPKSLVYQIYIFPFNRRILYKVFEFAGVYYVEYEFVSARIF
jgi:hypothetical protein